MASPALTERDIKLALLERLRTQFPDGDKHLVLAEMDIRGRGRVDVAVVGSYLEGWEIKSDRDSLRRLPQQVLVYSRVLSLAHLVVTEKHLKEAKRLLPPWWGIELAKPGYRCATLECVRRGRWNRCLDEIMVTGLLWKVDMVRLLREQGATKKRCRGTVAQLCRRVLADVPWPKIRAAVADRLRAKRGPAAFPSAETEV